MSLPIYYKCLMLTEQDAAVINNLLEAIHTYLTSFPPTSNRRARVQWRVERVGRQDAQRASNFASNYAGTDHVTLDLMERQVLDWTSDTWVFWTMRKGDYPQTVDPRGLMVEHFLRANSYQDA